MDLFWNIIYFHPLNSWEHLPNNPRYFTIHFPFIYDIWANYILFVKLGHDDFQLLHPANF